LHVFKSRVRANNVAARSINNPLCSFCIWLNLRSSSEQPATQGNCCRARADRRCRKVFISNAGADIVSQAAFKRAGEPDQAYTHFYSATQSWGRYEIVSAPADADLVFEIRFTAPISGCETCYQPQMGLTILDTKTHFILWTLTAPVQGAFRKATGLKNFDQGLNALMDDLKKLSAPSVATGEPANK
jgi:hypothetical protein